MSSIEHAIFRLQKETAVLNDQLEDSSNDGKVRYGRVMFGGSEFKVGDSAYFHPNVFSFVAKPPVVKKAKQDRSMVTMRYLSRHIIVFFGVR